MSEFKSAETHNPAWTCTEAVSREEVTCTKIVGLGSLDETAIELPLAKVSSGERSVVNEASIEEVGGAPAVTTSEPSTMPNTVDAPQPSFGVRYFGFSALNGDGEGDEQAGDHPNAVTAAIDLEMPAIFQRGVHEFLSSQEVKETVVDLPLGFVGDLQAAAQCSLAELAKGTNIESGCPADSRVGTFTRQDSGTGYGAREINASLINMVPENGYPAELGMYVIELQKWVMLYASVVHSDAGYMLQVRVPGILRAASVGGVSLTFFGDPAERDGGGIAPGAFFTNPTACSSGAVEGEARSGLLAEPRPARRQRSGRLSRSDGMRPAPVRPDDRSAARNDAGGHPVGL